MSDLNAARGVIYAMALSCALWAPMALWWLV